MYLDLCACLLVTKVSPAKTDELIEMLFGYDKGDQNSSDFKYGTAAEMLKNGLLLASCCRLKSRQQQRKLGCRWYLHLSTLTARPAEVTAAGNAGNR